MAVRRHRRRRRRRRHRLQTSCAYRSTLAVPSACRRLRSRHAHTAAARLRHVAARGHMGHVTSRDVRVPNETCMRLWRLSMQSHLFHALHLRGMAGRQDGESERAPNEAQRHREPHVSASHTRIQRLLGTAEVMSLSRQGASAPSIEVWRLCAHCMRDGLTCMGVCGRSEHSEDSLTDN